jgi:YD repeat-containing protein
MIRRLLVCVSLVGCTSYESLPPVPGEPVTIQLAPDTTNQPCTATVTAADGSALGTVAFTYDAQGRETQALQSAMGSTTGTSNYSYDNLAHLIHFEDFETDFSDVWDITYDSLGDTVDVIDTTTIDTDTMSFHLVYSDFDENGNPTHLTSDDEPGETTYSYDSFGRLVYEVDSGSDGVTSVTYDETARVATAYDSAGGMLFSTTTTTYDNQNRTLSRFTDFGMGKGGVENDYDGDRRVSQTLYYKGNVSSTTTYNYDCH